jgi:hypothetical protein
LGESEIFLLGRRLPLARIVGVLDLELEQLVPERISLELPLPFLLVLLPLIRDHVALCFALLRTRTLGVQHLKRRPSQPPRKLI